MAMRFLLIICQMYFMSLKIKEQKILIKMLLNRFTYGEYKVTSKANRVGMYVEGQPVKAFYEDMPAHQSVQIGTIQVKRDGTPIILLNDHYTLELSTNRDNCQLPFN